MKQILRILIALILLSSCTKENGNSTPSSKDYFIKAKLDGYLVEHQADAGAKIFGAGSHFEGFSRKELLTGYPGFSMSLESGIPVSTKTYTRQMSSVALMFRYYPVASKIYYCYTETDDFNITITEITNEFVSGTFNGTISEANNENDKIDITEGQFKLKIVE